jgi:transcriptional regulator NrdR family protein
MICINSLNEATRVTNSRASTKTPVVWRRRQGVKSGITFTTYERPALAENKQLISADGTKNTFNLGKLILSIAAAFSHDTKKAQYDSLWLAQTVEDKLSMSPEALTTNLIASTTYKTLKSFDEIAAVQYGARHQLVTTIRKRGRPSLSSS